MLKIDIEARHALGATHRIRSIPTMALFERGHAGGRLSGATDIRRILAWTPKSS